MRKLIITHKKSLRGLVNGAIHTEPILKKLNLLSLQDEVQMDMTKHAWLYVQNRMPAGIRASLEEMRDQRPLRRNRILNVPLSIRLRDNYQITYVLPTAINNMYADLVNHNTKTSLIQKVKNTLISRYQEIVTCNNIGCKECRVL